MKKPPPDQQMALPEPPHFNVITAEQTAARLGAEIWQDAQAEEFPYLPLDRQCAACPYTCKRQWRFAGLTGKSGRLYLVGPNCPVLWRFSPFNPLAHVISIKGQEIIKAAGRPVE